MGLLDKLVKKVVSGAVDSLLNQATNNSSATPVAKPEESPAFSATASAGSSPLKLKKEHNESFSTAISVLPSDIAPTGEAAFKKGKITEYFTDLLSKNLPDTDIRTDISPASLGLYIEGKQQNVPIVIYRAAEPVLALFLVPSQGYRRAAVINTMNACEDAGIPAIRFMDTFSNKPEYVIARVKAVMK